jgi:pimeloyl-ACP methyl ester carboxylesterase
VVKKISFRGADISYQSIGQGDPVFLIHGFAEDRDIWQSQADYLRTFCHLIIPDIPGSGKSDFNETLRTFDDLSEAIKAISEVEKFDDLILIGHSMGGYISLAFAEKYPQLLKGFGLFHSTAYPDTEEKKAARTKGIAFIREHGAGEFLKTTIPNLFSSAFGKDHQDIISDLIKKYAGFNPKALISYYEAMITRPDRTAVLRNIEHPVLFIIGEEDKAVPLQDCLEQSHLPSTAFIHVLKKTGHMGMIEQIALSNTFLEDFIRKSIDIKMRGN